MRKTVLAALASLFAFHLGFSPSAMAADEAKATTQQEKMKSCNKEAGAKSLKGDERKKFMSECLSAEAAPTQQEKMKSCNKEAGAKNLKGDERKKFMSECLKG